MLFFIAANVGGGQVFTFMASTTICWSGRSVLIFRWSPGNIILFALIDTSRILDFPSGFIMFLSGWCVMWFVFVSNVLRLVPICCAIGNRASRCVVGTVHLLPSNEIWLWTKSCFTLLSFMKVVPPMTGQWRFCAVGVRLCLCLYLCAVC